MRCISLWQPWATLLVTGQKKNETRDWHTSYRGQLLVHAAATKNAEVREYMGDPLFQRHLKIGWDKPLPFGAIVGFVNLKDCVSTDVFVPGFLEYAFGNYAPNRFAWITTNQVPFEEPIPFKGKQGFFDVPDELIPEDYLRLMRSIR